MLQDRVSNQGPLTYESGALPIALRGSAIIGGSFIFTSFFVRLNSKDKFYIVRIQLF